MIQHSDASSGGNRGKRKFFGPGRSGTVILAASVLLLAAVAGLVPDGPQDRDGWGAETDILAYPDSGLIYRITDGTSAFTAEKHDVEGGWNSIAKGTDVAIQNAVNAISADAGGNDHSIIFWGDGTQPANTLNAGSAKMTFGGSAGVYRNITLYGSLTSAVSGISNAAVMMTSGANVTSYADIAAKETAFSISGGATLDMLGGTVSGKSTVRVDNSTVNVFGATIKSTAQSILGKGGMINIRGGTVEGEQTAISNSNGGKVTISEDDPSVPTLIKEGTGNAVYYSNADGHPGVHVEMTGGTILGTLSVSNAAAAIKGGTVTRTGIGAAVSCYQGTLTISEDDPSVPTVITSLQRMAVSVSSHSEAEIAGGTIRSFSNICEHATLYLGTGSKTNITGGVIEAEHTAVYNYSGSVVNISGGTITAADRAICQHGGSANISGGTVAGAAHLFLSNTSGGSLTLSGAPAMSGKITLYALHPPNAMLKVLADFEPGTDVYQFEMMDIRSSYVAVTGGAAFIDNFAMINPHYELLIEGDDILTVIPRNVTVLGNNMTNDAPPKTYDGKALTFTLTPAVGYGLPASITVKSGTSTLTASSYKYDNATGTVTIPKIGNSITVTASGVKLHNVVFDPNNGNDAWAVTVHANTAIERPADPEHHGWTFLGWYDGDAIWMFADIVTDNVTLTANWAEDPDERFTVTFDPKNGVPAWYVTVPKHTGVSEPEAEPTSYGWTFSGWSYDGTPWDFADTVNDNITLTAEWTESPEDRWTVTFDPNNGAPEFAVSVIKGHPAERPDDPERYGWTFLGWYDGDAIWMFADIVTDDVTLTADWAEDPDERWTVTFDPDNGNGTWSVSVPKDSTVARPAGDPKMHGKSFFGWFDTGTGVLWDFGNSVTCNITLKAKWSGTETATAMVTETLTDGGGDGKSVTTAFALLAMLTAMALILLMLLRRSPRIIGTVTQNGKALANAEIAYTADGRAGKAVTDVYGGYAIPAAIGSEVDIVSVNGRSVSLSVTTERKVTELNVAV